VADFNDKQVKAFVANWFRASGQTKSKIAQQWQAFSEEIQKNLALKELTVTPVLLSLICLVLQDAGELPSQIAALYRKGIRLLLEKWNDRKDISEWEMGKAAYRQLSLEEKESLLTEIAARKFENPGNFVLFEQADLTRQIAQFLKLSNSRDGEAVLRAIEAQHGLLVERADELWSFSHLTFQEYFTVQWLNQLQQDQGLAEKIADKRWQELVKLAVKSQQPADQLLRLIRRAIDYSISNDQKIQDFLSWVQTKAESTYTPYKPAAIRIFYFDLAHDLARACAHDLARARDLAHDLARTRALDHALDLTLDLDHALDLALDLDLARTHDLACDIDRALDLARDHYPSLAIRLKQLRSQLPLSNEQKLQQGWQSKGQAWVQELRQLMIEHRDIGHDWQFTKPQRQALRRYYDANKFLVELLKIPGAVSDPVRQEIEDNLLLPIATLQQRLPDQYS